MFVEVKYVLEMQPLELSYNYSKYNALMQFQDCYCAKY